MTLIEKSLNRNGNISLKPSKTFCFSHQTLMLTNWDNQWICSPRELQPNLEIIKGCLRGVMVKSMDCEIVVNEFVLHSRYYVHFRANTLGKYPPSYGLNSTNYCSSRRIALALNNLQRLICHKIKKPNQRNDQPAKKPLINYYHCLLNP